MKEILLQSTRNYRFNDELNNPNPNQIYKI